MLKGREKKAPKLGHNLSQRLEVARPVPRGECFPVRLSTRVLNEAITERDDFELREGRAATAERSTQSRNERIPVERYPAWPPSRRP